MSVEELVLAQGDIESIARAVTSSHEGGRIMGRYMATSMPQELTAWLQSEIDRDTDPIELLRALAKLQAQAFACLVASVLHPSGDAKVAEVYSGLARTMIPEHAARVRAMGEAQ